MEKTKKAEQELLELEKIKKAAEEDIKNAPPETLRISKKPTCDQYYWRTDPKDTRGKYIRKSEEKLIKSLAQKEYAQKILVLVEPIIKSKRKCFGVPNEIEMREQMEEIYEKLSPSRQKLITPYLYTEDEYIKKWEEEKNQIKKLRNSQLPVSEIFTEKGECVRSKSEKILADKLYLMGIPYVYEVPVYLEGYGYIKPDFAVLNKETRREYYWEHLGMMDNKEYCEKAIKKIETFEKNEIFPGKNLILTYETLECPLNIKVVEKLISEYL